MQLERPETKTLENFNPELISQTREDKHYRNSLVCEPKTTQLTDTLQNSGYQGLEEGQGTDAGHRFSVVQDRQVQNLTVLLW